MLENTNFWESGRLDLFLNNKPTHAYIPPRDVQKVFNLARSKIANDGKIPIGIDHLPEDIINNNPILKKLNLLDVGYISAVEYDPTLNKTRIKEATLTNPLIKKLYDDGELEAVSIVSQVHASDCPQQEGLKVIDTERLDRVDIVAVGACESCNIPKPTGSNMVYARKPLKEETTMADENITIEQIEELLDKKLDEKLEEKLEPLNEKIESIEDLIEEDEADEETPEDETDEVAAMRAELEALKKENAEKVALAAASAKVDLAIRQGKIKPCDKETMTAFAMNSSEAFDNYIKDADVIVPLGARQSFNSGEEEGEPEEKDIVAEVNAAFNKGE